MSIARFSIKNSALVTVITIVVFILGLYFSTHLSREVFPSFDFGYITISTSYTGASPEEMENLVTIPIEDEISDVDGIDEITSTSSEGMSVIRVQAEADIEGAALDQLLNDIKNEVDKVNDLPEDADDPNCVKFDPEFGVISVGLWGDIPETELRGLADWMQDGVNRGPLPIGGDTDTPCQTAITPDEPYEGKAWSPTFRQIVDMGDLSRSLAVHAPGQSGQLGSRHYNDLIDLWLNGKYYPMLWTRQQVEHEAEGRLTLNP